MNKLLSFAIAVAALAGAGITGDARAADVKSADRTAGGRKVDACIGCHGIPGYQASFPEVYKVPMIAGQGAKYIVSALTQYKKGDRKHPTMRAIAASLTEEDMIDIAAFYEQLGKAAAAGDTVPEVASPAPAAVAALIQRGNCTSCHGANFSKPIDPTYPKLAGQHADYLYMALRAYQTDDSRLFGRANAVMKAMVKPYTQAELKQITEYLGSLPSQLRTVEQSRFRHSE